jgi:hypothetical protein
MNRPVNLPDRVYHLLGNHEHAHPGGRRGTSRSSADDARTVARADLRDLC